MKSLSFAFGAGLPARLFFSIAFLASMLVFSHTATAQAEGIWLNQDQTAHIEVYKGTGGKLYGKIIWLKEPNDEKGKAKTDPENPDPKLRSRSRMGMIVVSGFLPNGKDYWEGGIIYNPKDGKTYSCTMALLPDGTLKLRGYIGISLIGKTQIWTRVKK